MTTNTEIEIEDDVFMRLYATTCPTEILQEMLDDAPYWRPQVEGSHAERVEHDEAIEAIRTELKRRQGGGEKS